MKTILNLSVGITLLVMPQVSPTAHGASVPDAVTAAKAGESPVVAGADTLESLQERLQKAVGGQWRLYRRGAGFKERPSIGASFLTGHGVNVPYIIAPSSKDDKVGERPEDFEGNMALEVIATDNRYTVFAGPSYQPEVATKVLSIAGLTLSKEAEQYRLRHSAADSAAPTPPPTQLGKEQAPLSPGKLKEWLVGKEVVELTFAGPHLEPLKLRESLKTKVTPTDWDFRMSAGEGGGLGAFVRVCMKVTPDNVQRLLALQAELEPRGYPLQPQTAHIWSYAGNEPAREKARRLVPDVLTAAERGIKQILPEAQFAPQRRGKVVLGEIRYEFPGTNARGRIWVDEIRAQMVLRAVPPDDVVHLPRLGLMITSYYRPIPDGGAKDVSPKHASIRKSIREAIEPLIQLETNSPTTQPALSGGSSPPVFEHFIYLLHDNAGGAARLGMDSLVLVKMATNEFEARPVYSKSNLHIDWHPLGVCHGKLYGVKTGVLISVDLETGNAEEVDRRIESFAWRDQELYAFVRPPEGSLLLRVYDANMEAYRDISARPYLELVPAQASSVPRIQISPDHKCLAYFCRSNSVVLSHMYELRTVAVNDGTLKALSTWVGARRFLTGGGDVADGPPFAWLDSKTLLVVRDVSKKPQSIQGQSRIYAAESGRTEMILARVDMESGLMTDVAQLPQFEPQIGEPFFRVPNAGMAPSLVLGSLGQYRIDVPAGRLVEDGGIGGGYSYRRGAAAEELLFRGTLLDSRRAIPELAVSPDQSKIVWRARPSKGPARGAYTSEIRVHDAASGETRTVATEGIPGGWDERHRSFEGNLLWISTEELRSTGSASPPDGWKRFSHKPYLGDTPALVRAGESPAAASTDTLEPLRDRLQKEVGGNWRPWTSRAGSRERPAISATLPAWFNVTVPYLIAPASKDDEVGKTPKDYEGSIALEVIATDHRYTVCAGPSYEPEVMAKVLPIAGLTLSKEAEQYRLRHSAADWLDFRLAVTDQSGAVEGKSVPLANGPSPTQIEDYTKHFTEKGPNAGRQRGDPYVWFPRLDCCDVWPPLVTTSDRRAPHVLLSDKSEQVLLCGSKRPRPWSLKRVQAGEDAAGQPVVVMELDAVAAEHMAKLTSSNPGCALAVLFNNSVVQVIVLESKLSDRVVLSGKAFDKALVARIVRSLSECMMERRGTTEKPTRTDAQD